MRGPDSTQEQRSVCPFENDSIGGLGGGRVVLSRGLQSGWEENCFLVAVSACVQANCLVSRFFQGPCGQAMNADLGGFLISCG
jgi:hypothetical protein